MAGIRFQTKMGSDTLRLNSDGGSVRLVPPSEDRVRLV